MNYCFTLAESDFAEIKREYEQKFKTPLYCNGKIAEKQDANSSVGTIRWRENGTEVAFMKDGFNHFAS